MGEEKREVVAYLENQDTHVKSHYRVLKGQTENLQLTQPLPPKNTLIIVLIHNRYKKLRSRHACICDTLLMGIVTIDRRANNSDHPQVFPMPGTKTSQTNKSHSRPGSNLTSNLTGAHNNAPKRLSRMRKRFVSKVPAC